MEQRQAVTWWTRSHPPEAKDDPERVLGVVQGSSGLHVCLQTAARVRLSRILQQPQELRGRGALQQHLGNSSAISNAGA